LSCPDWSHRCCRKREMPAKTAAKMARLDSNTGRRKHYMLRVAKSRVTTVEVEQKDSNCVKNIFDIHTSKAS
jgi:hypothetical protein